LSVDVEVRRRLEPLEKQELRLIAFPRDLDEREDGIVGVVHRSRCRREMHRLMPVAGGVGWVSLAAKGVEG
jgi:hypothetical protein